MNTFDLSKFNSDYIDNFNNWFSNLPKFLKARDEIRLAEPLIHNDLYLGGISDIGIYKPYIQLGLAFRILTEYADYGLVHNELEKLKNILRPVDLNTSLNMWTSQSHETRILRNRGAISNGVFGFVFNHYHPGSQLTEELYDSYYYPDLIEEINLKYPVSNYSRIACIGVPLMNLIDLNTSISRLTYTNCNENKMAKNIMIEYFKPSTSKLLLADLLTKLRYKDEIDPLNHKSKYAVWSALNPSFDQYLQFLNLVIPNIYSEQSELDSAVEVITNEILLKFDSTQTKELNNMLKLGVLTPSSQTYDVLTHHLDNKGLYPDLPYLD